MRHAVAISHHNGLNRTPALPLAVRGWMDLISTEHCSNYVQVKEEHQALLACVNGEPAGVLTYWPVEIMKELAVGIGYVLPEFRGLGLYRKLWDALVEQAQAMGVAHISSATFLDNQAMRRVAAAQGRAERTVTLDFPVPPRPA